MSVLLWKGRGWFYLRTQADPPQGDDAVPWRAITENEGTALDALIKALDEHLEQPDDGVLIKRLDSARAQYHFSAGRA